MWIKSTKVKTKSGIYTYLQLVQSERIGGKTRQKVLANLGRADRLDREEVLKLLETIQNSTRDSLDSKQIHLLPSRKFGAPLVMEYALKSLGIWRFLAELSMHKKTEPFTTAAIFALLVYYTVSKEPDQLFADFYQEYF